MDVDCGSVVLALPAVALPDIVIVPVVSGAKYINSKVPVESPFCPVERPLIMPRAGVLFGQLAELNGPFEIGRRLPKGREESPCKCPPLLPALSFEPILIETEQSIGLPF